MLAATQEEIDKVTSYFEGQAPDLKVEFIQKVYSENVLGHCHDVWDVHTDQDRWWVITNPSNLYSQEQFPNMDLALTFHVGLCLRIPRSEKQKLSELPLEPFAQCYRYLSEASEALGQAQEVLGLSVNRHEVSGSSARLCRRRADGYPLDFHGPETQAGRFESLGGSHLYRHHGGRFAQGAPTSLQEPVGKRLEFRQLADACQGLQMA